jgi:hypothetical protein
MSKVTYRYEHNSSFLKKGVKHTTKENVVDGEFLTVYYLNKEGDKFYSMKAKETEKDKYEVLEIKNDKKETMNITEKELLKKLKELKLDNVINYMNKERGTYKGGAKRGTKKTSKKKVTKKMSKKMSKK